MRRVVMSAAGVAVLGAALFLLLGRHGTAPDRSISTADSVWYHASDVALLGTTGRPQLVEFFHPA
jgi:hypothetical protein